MQVLQAYYMVILASSGAKLPISLFTRRNNNTLLD